MARLKVAHAMYAIFIAQVAYVEARIGEGAVDPQDLPLTRPPGWTYRSRSSALKATVQATDLGVIIVRVEHLPLPDITPKMLNWFLSGIGPEQLRHKQMRHPKDCKVGVSPASSLLPWEHLSSNMTSHCERRCTRVIRSGIPAITSVF
jgi:hypothetical protein